MNDLRDTFAELDLLEVPDIRADTDARIADLWGSAPEPIPAVPTPRWRGPLIAAGTAVAILVVVGAAALLAQVDPTEVTETQPTIARTTVVPPATTEPDTPTTVPADEAAPVDGVRGEVVLEGLIVPNDVEYDPAGGLFFSETGAERVSRVEILPDGSLGEVEVLATGIDDAEGLALADDGALYVAGGDALYRIVDGVATVFAGGFADPEGLAIDANGHIYVSDDAPGSGIRITRLTVLPEGTLGERSEVASVPGASAKDIQFGPDGVLYVADNSTAVWAIEYDEDGSARPSEYATFSGEAPSALAFDEAGILYVGTAHGPSVWTVGPTEGAAARLTGFQQVEGLTFDQTGALYVVEVTMDQVIRFEKGTAGDVRPSQQAVVESDTSWSESLLLDPWASAIVDVASLPNGGFVVAVAEGGSVLWSRDGVDWTEADPDGQVSASFAFDLMSALPGDRVAVLTGSGTDAQVWIGDLETRTWESIHLDTAGMEVGIERMAIASNDREVLVVGELPSPTDNKGADSVVWTIEPTTGEVTRRTVHGDFTPAPDGGIQTESRSAVWFEDRWVIAMGNTTAVSSDGEDWAFGLDEVALASYQNAVTSLTVGSPGVLATTCGGWGPHEVWLSEDGLEWVKAPRLVPGPHSGSAYSDALGFVIADTERGRLWQSLDGRTWSYTAGIFGDYAIHDVAVSDERVFVARERGGVLLLTPD